MMRNRLLGLIFLSAVTFVAAPLAAQSAIEGRVDRLEGEMRAVQRKVFPGGRDQYVQPQITPADPTGELPGSTSPSADQEARINALEGQLSALTNQVEVMQNKQRQMDEGFAAFKRTVEARLKALEDGASSTGDTPAPIASPTPAKPAASKPAAVKPPPVVATRDPARAAKVAAVERPVTGDAGEDAYLYGYRLWQAKYYPEAQAQFKSVVATYPKHKRASYAQNLLGRAYLDEGKPSLASIAFYDNYKKMPDGDRAPDSLYYLGQALIKLNKPADACKVYGELGDVYATRIDAKMKADIARARTEAKCK